MTPDELRSELDAGRLRPAYLLLGREPLLRDDALAAICDAALGEGPRDFNLDRLDGERAAPAALLEAVGTLPLMAPRRVVVLREPESQRGAARAMTDAVAEAVAGLDPDAGALLIVVAGAADARSRWVRAFSEPAVVVRCDPPRAGRGVAAFARAEARRQGVALGSGVAEQLAERIGPQLLMLRQEIAKAALIAGPGAKVTREHVTAGASDVADEPIWDLTDAVGEGRSADALASLGRLLRGGAAPPAVLGALVSHYRRLLRVRSGSRVSGPPFVQRKLESQAERYSQRRLLACLSAIHDTDLALKGSGALGPQLALERLLLHLGR